jgi:anthranilate synthase/aminodeoxychorismate synthase-like glutamine amidotransferase
VNLRRVLVVDNYDSFVYNLVQYLGELGSEPLVVRNDTHSVDELMQMECDAILISPGPGRPEEAGVTCELIRAAAGRVPLLGVCLGHQAIGHVFGASVVRAPELRHGKTSHITHDGAGVFASLPSPLEVTRYHSLVIDTASLPSDLVVTATASDGTVMGVRHRKYEIEGLQFHPESILTQHGHTMLQNFLSRRNERTLLAKT